MTLKTNLYATICGVAVALLVWSGRRFAISPLGLFWHLPLLISAFGLIWSTWITNNYRLAFVSGLLLICLAFVACILGVIALVAGSANLTTFSSIAAVVFGVLATLNAGMEDLQPRDFVEQGGDSKTDPQT